MSSFTQFDANLSIQYHHEASRILGKDYWVVIDPFVYSVNSKDSGIHVPIHSGFLTDGASVPRPLWAMIPPWGDYGQAVVVHDYLCDYGQAQTQDGIINYSRKHVDMIFYQALQVLNVSPTKLGTIKAGIEAYRLLLQPKVPNIKPEKRDLEELLIKKYNETGSFQL